MEGPILPLNSFTVCYKALPTLLGTLFKHLYDPKRNSDEANRSELSFQQAFWLAKNSIQRFTHYSIEDVQRLANASQPTPWSVRVIRVSIPSSTCSSAAEYLIKAFGKDEITHVIGGQNWWQLRDVKGGAVEGEWVAMKRHLSAASASPNSNSAHPLPSSDPRQTLPRRKSIFSTLSSRSNQKISNSRNPQTPVSPLTSSTPTQDSSNSTEPQFNTICPYEDDLDKMPCMLYIHGGAYYFGSVNTHRHTIWRYARKMAGRAFAVNYRHAPQYPFPCALADCLAAYLYLIRPPPDAKHRPIDPSKMVIAGDSAGGGLSLALLTLIRDVGLPLPAGGVLISPWVDLTHSFPSILTNTHTDIVPSYGFIHQPSVLWPLPPASPSHIKPSTSTGPSLSVPPSSLPELQDPYSNPYQLKLSPELKVDVDPSDGTTPVIKLDGKLTVPLNYQIQLYATNDQLTHPYCSPLFSPSLGGLPPLLITAGDSEVLRDEILYVAHRAAHPDKYPLREDLLNAHPERKANATQYPPTKVHLQVYDEMFHVLPLFSFLRPAKYCYRAIGSFCKYVTSPQSEPPPEPLSSIPPESNEVINQETPNDCQQGSEVSDNANVHNSSALVTVPKLPRIDPQAPIQPRLPEATLAELEHTIYHSSLPNRRPSFVDNMIRERVGMDGKIRPLESEDEMDFSKLKPEELGIIKDGPVRRWAEGRRIWDGKFTRTYKKIHFQRKRHIKQSHKREQNRIKQDQKNLNKRCSAKVSHENKETLKTGSKVKALKPFRPENTSEPAQQPNDGALQESGLVMRQEGTLDTANIGSLESAEGSDSLERRLHSWVLPEGERPPPSSIAARKDTPEALKLAKALELQVDSKQK
ncbi:hypothetical protein O181_008893 [Austropuccinia psidii MF-1]|uniref:Alpha/beta hydrolase fold-3 domain-containing protein n=1 Tax=Austropuccinia psidii MF-1 TaxID=1389203 RepID=A0A9Q3GIX7_9BASI|nr:hypothetical protein [Austropuccinia psidii MF-1]